LLKLAIVNRAIEEDNPYLFNMDYRFLNPLCVEGESVILLAVEGRAPSVVRYLLEKGGDKNTENTEGDSLLHICSFCNDVSMARVLVGAGADINKKSRYDGFTPLHAAISEGNVCIAKYLIEIGVDVNIKDNHGHLPLDFALMTRMSGVVSMLIKKEGDRKMSYKIINPWEEVVSYEEEEDKFKVKTLNKKEGEQTILNEIFGSDFSFGAAEEARMTFNNTIAIRVGNRYKAYDPKKKSVVDSTELTLDTKGLIMKLPVQTCQEGDVIIKCNRYYFVKGVNSNNEISVVSLDDSKIETFAPETTLFGINFFTKVVNVFNFDGNNGSNPMMMFMASKLLSKTSSSNNEDLMGMLAMSSLSGDVSQVFSNPMMMMMMMGGESNSFSSMLPMMMMMGGKGENPFGSLFGPSSITEKEVQDPSDAKVKNQKNKTVSKK
jgi:hypothetical protein